MIYEDFIKYGNKVRRTYRDYNFYAAVCRGYGSIPYEEKEEIVTIAGTPRDKDSKRFISLLNWFDEEETEIKVRDKDGDEYYVTLDELSVYAEIEDLSFDDLVSLRKQISLGSIYLADYDNCFGVDRNVVCNYAEGFGEEIGWKDELDTPENFALYCRGELCIDAA